jgi:hypothetical protein
VLEAQAVDELAWCEHVKLAGCGGEKVRIT